MTCGIAELDLWLSAVRLRRRPARRRHLRAQEPFGWRPTMLLATVCHDRWLPERSHAAARRQQGPRAARPKLIRGGLRWALTAIVCQHVTVARVAEAVGVA